MRKYLSKVKFIFSIIILNIMIKNLYINIIIRRQKSYIPKISIFIPIYNKQEYIIESIKSIQKQTLKNIEIIAVNDCSTDNSLKILKKLAKRDSRIKIINNNNNHGLLYSRSMGILNSSGEYLMNLDPDDKLDGKNCLKFLYKIANLNNIDVVEFSYFHNGTYYLKCIHNNKIIKQPLLFNSSFGIDNLMIDDVLWNKLINRKLMLKVYILFKQRIYNRKWNYGEDTVWSVLINKNAESKICINKNFYIYNVNNDSLLNNNNNNFLYIKNLLMIIEMYNNIFKKQIEYKYIVAQIIDFIEYHYNNSLISLLKENLEIKNKWSNILYFLKRKTNFSYMI